MSDLLRIEIAREFPAVVEDGKIIESEEADGYEIYACVDSIRAWIGCCTDIESLEEVVSEENLIGSIYESCSETELFCLIACLEFHNNQYEYFGTIKTAIKTNE